MTPTVTFYNVAPGKVASMTWQRALSRVIGIIDICNRCKRNLTMCTKISMQCEEAECALCLGCSCFSCFIASFLSPVTSCIACTRSQATVWYQATAVLQLNQLDLVNILELVPLFKLHRPNPIDVTIRDVTVICQHLLGVWVCGYHHHHHHCPHCCHHWQDCQH